MKGQPTHEWLGMIPVKDFQEKQTHYSVLK